MSYYDEFFKKIDELIVCNENVKAVSLLEEELNMPYVPSDILIKLKEYYAKLNVDDVKLNKLSDEQITSYLKMDEQHQLFAVNELNERNLRNYLDIVNEYLSIEGYINAKVLLIDSLIRQEISEEIIYNQNGLEYKFIPRYVLLVEESDGYTSGKKYINEYFLKDPSKAKMALDLLYKELMLKLPISLDAFEGLEEAKKIIEYVIKAFA